MDNKYISLAHGNGGRFMRELIEQVFAKKFANGNIDVQADAVKIFPPAGELMVSTDGFIVQPLFFPGGNIGSLAVHGTTNDLAVSGAVPLYLTLSAFIEEGMAIAELEIIVDSMANAASDIGVKIVAGDTKVLNRGEGGGVYFATSGVGVKDPRLQIGLNQIQDGDKIVVSGSLGDHGICVMLARQQFGLSGDLKSDSASVLNLAKIAYQQKGVRFMRDPTRGGLVSVCHEIAQATHFNVRLQQSSIPIKDEVNSVCEMLGYDPLYLACEGRIVAIVQADQADQLMSKWQQISNGQDACVVGEIEQGKGRVILHTELGGERLLEELEDDPLPRIC
ncbi:MAG: hydrogenase expression/formation protein HypE [Methylococcales bacterium]|jgi:hydrogenase expression/formation protein HypE|nr:hydrogenase expression/formation protein HypE [Methylococcales bacterium]MBT7408275.1 hydrogenase expression/formation protein HypE [Methylococcales bacterium]